MFPNLILKVGEAIYIRSMLGILCLNKSYLIVTKYFIEMQSKILYTLLGTLYKVPGVHLEGYSIPLCVYQPHSSEVSVYSVYQQFPLLHNPQNISRLIKYVTLQ